MRPIGRFLAVASMLMAVPASAVEYALTYFSIPGRIDYVRTDFSTGRLEPMDDIAAFGSFGFTAVVPIPGSIGPFTPAVEAGFALPAGSQAFDHREMARSAANRNDSHDGDFTTLNLTTVPLLAAIRYSQPSENVTFGGEAAVGVVFLGLSSSQTFTTYDASDTTVISHETVRRQDVQVALAVSAAAGLVVPATESLDLRLYGGMIWVADVPSNTTDDVSPPVRVYGPSTDLPGFTIGGLGFMLRLALNVTL